MFNFLDKEIQSRERTYSFRFNSENYYSTDETKIHFKNPETNKAFSNKRFASRGSASILIVLKGTVPVA